MHSEIQAGRLPPYSRPKRTIRPPHRYDSDQGSESSDSSSEDSEYGGNDENMSEDQVDTGGGGRESTGASSGGSESDGSSVADVDVDNVTWGPIIDPELYRSRKAPFNGPSGLHDGGCPAGRSTRLNSDTTPIELFNLIMTPKLRQDIRKWSNKYAESVKDQKGDTYYPTFTPFEDVEVDRFLALLIKHGVCPMPRLSYRMKDPDHHYFWGDNRDRNLFEEKEVRVQHFRTFMHFSDHEKADASDDPYAKVRPVFDSVMEESKKNWLPGKKISGDEQTIGTRSRTPHRKKLRGKKVKNGIQLEAICDNGYTYAAMFRDEDPPLIEGARNASATHRRQLYLIAQLPYQGHYVFYDNYYISLRFVQWGHKLYRQNIGGTCQRVNRGLPLDIIGIEIPRGKKAQDDARGKLFKAAVTTCGVVAFAIYDKSDKITHMLGRVWDSIEMLTKEREVWSKEEKKMITIRYKRSRVQDEYNLFMNGVDIADQLRELYNPDKTQMRNKKWTWPVFIWALGTTLVNAYKIYCWLQDNDGMKPLPQAEFRELIATALIGDIDLSGDVCDKEERPSRKRRLSSHGSSSDAEDKVRMEELGVHGIEWLPTKSNASGRCQLCRRLVGERKSKPAGMKCSHCNIKVCKEHWNVWHSTNPLPQPKKVNK